MFPNTNHSSLKSLYSSALFLRHFQSSKKRLGIGKSLMLFLVFGLEILYFSPFILVVKVLLILIVFFSKLMSCHLMLALFLV